MKKLETKTNYWREKWVAATWLRFLLRCFLEQGCLAFSATMLVWGGSGLLICLDVLAIPSCTQQIFFQVTTSGELFFTISSGELFFAGPIRTGEGRLARISRIAINLVQDPRYDRSIAFRPNTITDNLWRFSGTTDHRRRAPTAKRKFSWLGLVSPLFWEDKVSLNSLCLLSWDFILGRFFLSYSLTPTWLNKSSRTHGEKISILNERPVPFLFLLPTNRLIFQPQTVPFLASDLSDIVRRSQIGITLLHAYCIKRYYSAWVHCHCWRREVLFWLDKHEHGGKTRRYLNTQQHPRKWYSTWGTFFFFSLKYHKEKHLKAALGDAEAGEGPLCGGWRNRLFTAGKKKIIKSLECCWSFHLDKNFWHDVLSRDLSYQVDGWGVEWFGWKMSLGCFNQTTSDL